MLEIDRNLVEELELNQEQDLPTEDKISYLDEQLDQMQRIVWRLRVDTMLMTSATKTDEGQELEARKKINEYKEQTRQTAAAITNLLQLRKELVAWAE